MRKEILERAHKLEEKIHVLGGVLATSFVLTFLVDRWRTHGHEEESMAQEVLHWVLIGADVVILSLFVGILLFRLFGLAKPSRGLVKVIDEVQLKRKMRQWFTSELGDPAPRVVRFCTEADIEELVELNHSAFKNSVFEVEEQKLMRRNASWIRRNPRIFMLMIDPFNRQNYVGYSAMLPLTEEGLSCYLDAGIKDADIPAAFVAGTKAATAGVLIFAVHLKKDYSFQKSQATRNYSIYFLTCVVHHLETLFPRPKGRPPTPYPPIYVQTEWPAMRRRLERHGFVETHKVSADGYDLLVLEHPSERADRDLEPVFLEQSPKRVIEA